MDTIDIELTTKKELKDLISSSLKDLESLKGMLNTFVDREVALLQTRIDKAKAKNQKVYDYSTSLELIQRLVHDIFPDVDKVEIKIPILLASDDE